MITINATILAAGDEEQFGGFFLTCWDYLETQLQSLGINTQRGEILNKDVNYCMSLLGEATRQSDLVIILAAPRPRTATLVAALLAKGLGLGLSVSDKARECVQLHADRVATELSSQDEAAFCTVPAGAVTLQNPTGFLQGYAITSRRQLLMVLPAAPSELQHSFVSYVGELVSRFAANTEQQTVAAAVVQSSPIAPAAVAQSSPIAPATVHSHSPEPAPKSQSDTVVEVCGALEQSGITIAIAESGTSGALAQTLGSTPSQCLNPSNCFSGKEELGSLDVSPELLSRCGTVSPQAAAALALAARSRCATSLGVAITCSSRKSGLPPVAYIAVTDGQKVWSKKFAASGNAHQLKLGAVLDTLGILNLYARGSGLPAGASVAAALDISQSPAPVQSTGIVSAVKGKLSGLIPRQGNSPLPKGSEDEAMARTNLIQRLRRGKLTRNDKIRLGAVAMFLCIFVGSMIYIGSVFKESTDNVKLTDDLKSMFTTSDKVPDSIRESYPKSYQTKFASLYAQNADIAGWIKIDDTKVDYPVVQSADNIFYERKDFTRASNQHGIPFLDFRVDNRAPSTNTVIYAHNMNDGQMFGELLKYKSLAYYKENPIVQYDSVYRDSDYKIFGIVLCKKDDPDFDYHNYIERTTDKDMTEYVTKIRERSLINTGVDVRTDDELLTLSTCDYDFKSATGERIARFVVFARRVREGEGLDVDTSKATLNMNPVMPKEWYDTLAKQQETERKKHEEQQAAAVNKKWLTANELETLSAEEQKTVAANREADAAKYLTNDEASWMDIDEMVYTIKARKKEFVLYLTSSEQSSLSLSKRISLSEDRASLAREYLSDDEIASAGKWSRIEALIRERQNETKIPDEAKWLTAEEIRTLSVEDKNYTIADRKAQALAAGVTDAEIASTKTWSAMKALIASKSKTTPEQYIKQNPQWLDDRDSGLTVDELKNLISSRKQSAKDAGLGSSEIAKHNKWETLEAAINAANANKGEAAQIKELVAKNNAWLGTADASGKTLAQVQSLLADRQKQATDVGLDIATLSKNTNWTATKAAIEAKKKELEGQAEANRQKYIADNLGLLDEGDKSLSLADLKKLADGRRAEAKAVGVTDAEIKSSGSWAGTQAIIASKLPPVKPPVVPPTDPVVPPTDPVVPPTDPVVPPTDPPAPPPDPTPAPPPNSPAPPPTDPPPASDTPPEGGGTATA